ncbi:MAG TPA: Wzz/FepE/Etk N-terminal domain-containing protein, partial [Longimicrobiaceae bacterium]|nr:Wzz/FepE/Etk N-terminal domain-containing protein [Longimicrobiaceae bacterium]
MIQFSALPPQRDITAYGSASVDPPAPSYPPGRPYAGDSEVRLEEVWGLASRNRWLILGILLVALGAAALRNHLATPIYEAWTTIRVEDPQTNPISNEPAMALGSDETIETEMEVLRSFSFAEMVVDSLNLQLQVTEPERYPRASVFEDVRVAQDAPAGRYVLQRSGDGFAVRTEEGVPLNEIAIGEEVTLPGVAFRLTPEAAERDRIGFQVRSFEAAVGSTRASLVVNQVDPNIRMIRLSSRGPDRGLTAEIANAYAEILIAQRGREHKTEASSTVAFLEEQIDSLALHLSVAEDDLREFQEAEQIVNLPAEGTAQI